MIANMSGSALTAARGTLLSIALRLLSFLLSQLTVRFVSAATLGKASVPLELLLSTALFVGREGFRLALTKEIGGDGDDARGGDVDRRDVDDARGEETDSNKWKDQQIANVSWLSVPVGAVLSLLALSMHLRGCGKDDVDSDQEPYYALWDYKLAGILYCLASFVESLSEPLVIRCLQQMDVATKAKAEGVALVAKSLSCFGCLYFSSCGWYVRIVILMMGDGSSRTSGGSSTANFAVTAFGISQLVYASVFTSIMYRKARSSKGGIRWPKNIKASKSNPYREKDGRHPSQYPTRHQNFHWHTLHLVLIFTLQGLFKHALTEADKFVLSGSAGSYDQGVYALAASYGGLAARLLLQPLEENARLLFSRQGALVAHGNVAGDRGNTEDDRGFTSNLLQDLEDSYFFFVRVVLYIGFLFAAIGSNYSSVLLRLLAGSRWGSNPEASAALSAFCVYTAFLALNGITEAFVYGVARSGNDVGKIGIAHAVIGGLFALIAPGFVTKHGSVGLIAANCVSMALRSAYSLQYARSYFVRAGKTRSIAGILSRIFPHVVVTMAFGASFVVCRVSSKHIYDAQLATGRSWIFAGAQHITVGVMCVITIVGLSLWLELDIREAIQKSIKRKRE